MRHCLAITAYVKEVLLTTVLGNGDGTPRVRDEVHGPG